MAKPQQQLGATTTAASVSNDDSGLGGDNPIYLKWASKMTEARMEATKQKQADGKPVPGVDKKAGLDNSIALGVAREHARMGKRHVSPAVEARAAALGWRLEHLEVTIGTVVHGVDLSQNLSEEQVAVLRALWLERKVIGFRNQNITVEQQLEFAKNFGTLDAFPWAQHLPGQPLAFVVSNEGTETPTLANGWHTDVTWMEKPSLGSMIYMTDVPENGGGATLFADSHAAYLGLPAAWKRKIRGVTAVNDYRVFLMAEKFRGTDQALVDELKNEIPFGISHPIVRTHPETGKQGLYFSTPFIRRKDWVGPDGEVWSREECEKTLKFLEMQHMRPEYQCRFNWEKGSVAMFDNRSCQHYAAMDYLGYHRKGYRVTIGGTKPFFDPDVEANVEAKLVNYEAMGNTAAARL